MTERMERPWALMRHHAGWADVFHIETESADSITGMLTGSSTMTASSFMRSVDAASIQWPFQPAAPEAPAGASPAAAAASSSSPVRS